ncbi:MAG: hypothetical protein J0L84_02070 [Verrucomicrobia bacterium]|nr:hypothetical protein [Verrucomicrobiota bacterium]
MNDDSDFQNTLLAVVVELAARQEVALQQIVELRAQLGKPVDAAFEQQMKKARDGWFAALAQGREHAMARIQEEWMR